jgi:glutamate racemase
MIGIFDSGYGGLTIFSKIQSLLPEYDYIYLGDNARAPYGTRSFEIVYQFTRQAVKKLFDQGCLLVILACNTASAKALRTIQQNDLPLWNDPTRRALGVIRPTVEIVNTLSQTKHVGVLGTSGTVSSHSYELEINKLFPQIAVTSEACPMWVPLVENNEHEDDGADFFVKKYLENILRKDTQIDTLLLGCTHYPLLEPKIRKYLPTGITLFSQGERVAESLKDYLFRHKEMETRLSRNGTCSFLTTESAEKFSETASQFLKRNISAQHIHL